MTRQNLSSNNDATGGVDYTQMANIVSDPSVKKIIVPPNGTGLETHTESPKGFFTLNTAAMAERIANKGSKQRPPSSAEASRFSQRIHSV